MVVGMEYWLPRFDNPTFGTQESTRDLDSVIDSDSACSVFFIPPEEDGVTDSISCGIKIAIIFPSVPVLTTLCCVIDDLISATDFYHRRKILPVHPRGCFRDRAMSYDSFKFSDKKNCMKKKNANDFVVLAFCIDRSPLTNLWLLYMKEIFYEVGAV